MWARGRDREWTLCTSLRYGVLLFTTVRPGRGWKQMTAACRLQPISTHSWWICSCLTAFNAGMVVHVRLQTCGLQGLGVQGQGYQDCLAAQVTKAHGCTRTLMIMLSGMACTRLRSVRVSSRSSRGCRSLPGETFGLPVIVPNCPSHLALLSHRLRKQPASGHGLSIMVLGLKLVLLCFCAAGCWHCMF